MGISWSSHKLFCHSSASLEWKEHVHQWPVKVTQQHVSSSVKVQSSKAWRLVYARFPKVAYRQGMDKAGEVSEQWPMNDEQVITDHLMVLSSWKLLGRISRG